MIIMQITAAKARREYLEDNNLVIFSHQTEESICVQYHPKTIRGCDSVYIVACLVPPYSRSLRCEK